MIVEAVLISLILGFLRRGKIMNFAYMEIKWIYLFMVGAIVQAIVFRLADANGSGFTLWLFENFYMLHISSYFIILIPLILNIRWQGFQFMAFGTFLNFIPILANSGKMPVKVPVGYDPVFDLGHSLWIDSTRFKFLSDFIFVGPPYPLPKVLSIGDLFLIIGVFWFIQSIMTNGDLTKQTLEA